jgi:hypothetical protein
MQPTSLLLPVFVQIALTFFLQFWMGYERISALRRRDVRIPDIALGQRAWPARVTQIANAFHNQLELPLLFYALVALALITSKVDVVLVSLAWLFVLLRLMHAAVHTTSNSVRPRFYIYLAGSGVLLGMWAYFALDILAASA